jgi:hypothetical protein
MRAGARSRCMRCCSAQAFSRKTGCASASASISAIVWLTVLIYWLGNFVLPAGGPAGARDAGRRRAVAAAPFFSPAGPCPTRAAAFRFHLLISLLAYSLFTIASLHVLLMAMIERRLHDGALPPAAAPAAAAHHGGAAVSHHLGRVRPAHADAASGVVFSEECSARPLRSITRRCSACCPGSSSARCWRAARIYGWRGRIAVRWTLAGFLTLVLAYIGSKFVLEVILGRA